MELVHIPSDLISDDTAESRGGQDIEISDGLVEFSVFLKRLKHMLQQVGAAQFRIRVHIRIQILDQSFASEPVCRKQTDIQQIRHVSGNDLCLQPVDARIPILFIGRGIVIVLGIIRHFNTVVRIAAVETAYHSAGEGVQIHDGKSEHFLLGSISGCCLRQDDQVVFNPVYGLLAGCGDNSAVLQYADAFITLTGDVTVDPVEKLH